jgi:hypothetical protein
VQQYESQLKSDDLIAHHLDLLYDKMLEANLLKIIHPYRYQRWQDTYAVVLLVCSWQRFVIVLR